jgi:hypothetical protein
MNIILVEDIPFCLSIITFNEIKYILRQIKLSYFFYSFHPVACRNMSQYIIHTIYSLTQLVCKWQHVSAYYQAIIRPFAELIDQVCTICWSIKSANGLVMAW